MPPNGTPRTPITPAALPPPPSDEAVRLAAVRALMELVSDERCTTTVPLQLLSAGAYAGELLESPEAALARAIGRGETPAWCAALLGVDYAVIAAALADLARGARVDWAAPASRPEERPTVDHPLTTRK